MEESFFKFCFWRVDVVLCTLRLQYGADINIDNRFSHPRFTLFNLSLLQKPILALGFAFTGQDEITLLKTSELFSHVTELVPLSVLMKTQPEPWAPVPVAHRGNLFFFWSILTQSLLRGNFHTTNSSLLSVLFERNYVDKIYIK